MAKKKNFDSQTNPVRCKKEDKEMLDKIYIKLRDFYYYGFEKVELTFNDFKDGKILVEKRSEE